MAAVHLIYLTLEHALTDYVIFSVVPFTVCVKCRNWCSIICLQEIGTSIPRVLCTSLSPRQWASEPFEWCPNWWHIVVYWQQCV